MPLNVLFVTNIPTPYRIPLFNELRSQLADRGIRIKFAFAALTYERRKWAFDMSQCEFDYEVLQFGKLPYPKGDCPVFTYPGLLALIGKEKPAVIITPAFNLGSMKVWLNSWLRGTPYIIWSGDIQTKGRTESRFRRLQRRILLARASALVSYGNRARDYLVGLGVDPERICIGINTVDTTYFQEQTARARNEVEPSGETLKHILYVGNLEIGKRLDHLLAAIEVLARTRRDFVLEIVGSGSQEKPLQVLVERLGICHCVRFHGFLQRPDVVRHLARANCFAFPSEYDVWGLVLVEAMAAAVPCVSSVHAGATQDLIQDGVTGFAVDFSQTQDVSNRLAWLLDHPAESRAMGARASQFIAERINLHQSAAGFVEAIQRTPARC